MAIGKLTVDFTKMPEVIFMLRREMAKLLREEADGEGDPRLAKRLREIADVFEVGGSA